MDEKNTKKSDSSGQESEKIAEESDNLSEGEAIESGANLSDSSGNELTKEELGGESTSNEEENANLQFEEQVIENKVVDSKFANKSMNFDRGAVVTKVKKIGEQSKAIRFTKVFFYYLLAFAISFGIGVIVFKAKNIAPFGDNSLLCMDLWGQYFPMYVQQATADVGADMFYSWNGAFGYNNWAQNAYYCYSIFLFIFKFLPVSKMIFVFDWICLVKISLSAVTCLAFLTYKLQKKSPVLIAGAVSYSLCAYALAYISQPMWTDSLIYIPLILIGLERLIYNKKTLLYTLMLAITIISNFYIGFSICIFIVLYFICNSLSQIHFEKQINEETGKVKRILVGKKDFGKTFLRFSLNSILAGAISAIVTIPILLAIGNTAISEAGKPENVEWYGSTIEYLQMMMPRQELHVGYSGVNIATSIMVFLLIPLYFLNKKVRISERIINALFLVFLFISMRCNLLDYMWHGFHFPNQLPGRWTFLFSLLAVLLSCIGLAKTEGLTPIRAIFGVGIGLFIVKAVCKGEEGKASVSLEPAHYIILAVTAVVVLILSFIVWYYRKLSKNIQKLENPILEQIVPLESNDEENFDNNEEIEKTNIKQIDDEAVLNQKSDFIEILKKHSTWMKSAACCCAILLAGLQIYDSGSNFIAVSQFESNGLLTSNEPGYTGAMEKFDHYGNKWNNGNDDFYRIEGYPGYTFNPSMLGNYHSMGHYSSTMQGTVYELLQYMGNRVYAADRSTIYNLNSVVQNSLFGIKYFLDVNRSMYNVIPGVNLIEENEDCNIWENPTVLPVAYAVSDEVLKWVVTDEVRAIQTQNDLLNKMCGQEVNVFQKMNSTSYYYEDVVVYEDENWNNTYFTLNSGAAEAKFHYVYTCEQDGPVYLESNFRTGKIYVNWSNGSMEMDSGLEKFKCIGTFSAGDVVNVDVTLENVQSNCCGLNLYRFDMNAWNDVYTTLLNQSLDVNSFETTYLSGEITMPKEGLVFSSIAQDGGWHAYCDGEEVDTILIGNALVGVKIPEGTHTLEYKYHVPGLRPMLPISIIGFLLTIWFGCPKLCKKVLHRK